ncbi:unnamed protein product [Ranitomeya imitator]|uniref:Mitochondrial import receptor subunit TOM7 homolog n=1 Tax=Ranitomeya imitator TaxID=111125 RepID=A0ABN9MHX1_9NEOB|nr:unnamed protein product [Ranitomeya imitator]
MPELSKEAKQRLQKVFKCGQFTIRWGFIPLVLYLGTGKMVRVEEKMDGFKRGADPGMPEPSVLRFSIEGMSPRSVMGSALDKTCPLHPQRCRLLNLELFLFLSRKLISNRVEGRFNIAVTQYRYKVLMGLEALINQ